MSDDEKVDKVAGREPAVKAGGMRIVQHKHPNAERPGKDPVEIVGLSNPAPNIQSNADAVMSTSLNTNTHSMEASHIGQQKINKHQAANFKPISHIQQPRK